MTKKPFQTVSFLFHRTLLRYYNTVIVGDDEMKNVKIIIIIATLTVLAFATISVALASSYNNSAYYGGMMGYSSPNTDNDWRNEMIEHMKDHWDEVQDEEWFDEMQTYMNEHLGDIENQEWFDEMIAHMEGQNFDSNYHYGYGCH